MISKKAVGYFTISGIAALVSYNMSIGLTPDTAWQVMLVSGLGLCLMFMGVYETLK